MVHPPALPVGKYHFELTLLTQIPASAMKEAKHELFACMSHWQGKTLSLSLVFYVHSGMVAFLSADTAPLGFMYFVTVG